MPSDSSSKSPPPKKGPTVRFLAMRAGLAALARVAPATAERVVLDLFARPARFGVTRDPAAAGLPAHRFLIQSHRLAAPVTAWDWGDGPTIVLVHGWAGQAAQLSSFVAPLVTAGFHVVAFDQPAHGQSPGRRANVVDFAAAVAAVGARLSPIHGIVGHSLGATAAVMAVRAGLAVERVVLLAPPADPAPFAHSFARRMGLPPARADGVVARARQLIADASPAVPTTPHAPVLVMHDRADPEVPFAHSEAITATWPGSQLVPLEGLGHRKLLREPRVIEAAVSFLTAPAARQAVTRRTA
jgi:pimeloyl-ACP methyl ester carboxylesterase